MNSTEDKLTNHQITVFLKGGAVIGPFNATWDTESLSDVRTLTKDFDHFLNTGEQSRYKYHIHDAAKKVSHSLMMKFENVAAIYDHVDLKG